MCTVATRPCTRSRVQRRRVRCENVAADVRKRTNVVCAKNDSAADTLFDKIVFNLPCHKGRENARNRYSRGDFNGPRSNEGKRVYLARNGLFVPGVVVTLCAFARDHHQSTRSTVCRFYSCARRRPKYPQAKSVFIRPLFVRNACAIYTDRNARVDNPGRIARQRRCANRFTEPCKLRRVQVDGGRLVSARQPTGVCSDR